MRILAVTSGRADATPLGPVVKALEGVDCNVRMIDLEDDGLVGSMRCVEDFLGSVAGPNPDMLLLLGDRYETLAAALATTVAQIPIAHIHGGEASFGSFDNQIRDAITKLAHIHFVVAEPMKQRLLDLGEEEHRIHVVGAPGLDNLVDLPPRKPGKYFVVTYHPATLAQDNIDALIEALRAYPGYRIIWTGANGDPGGAQLNWRAEDEWEVWSSLPPGQYVELCRNAVAVVGNSSSGLIEAPTLEVPTVNVGARQDGRLKGPSVFDCTEDHGDIERALQQAIDYDGPFDNPYGGPGASAKIAEILSTVEIDMVKRW